VPAPAYYDEAGRPVYPGDPGYDYRAGLPGGGAGALGSGTPSVGANPNPPYRTLGGQALDDYRNQDGFGKARQILLDPAGLFQPIKVNPQYLGGSPEAVAAQLGQNQVLGDYYRGTAADASSAAGRAAGVADTAVGAGIGGYSNATRTAEDARLLTGAGSGLAAEAAAVRSGGIAGQNAAIGGMLQAANARTPSLAEAQARAGAQQIQQQQLAQAAGAQNQALAARNAMYAGGNAAATIANQQASLRAQEEALRQQRIVQANEAAAAQFGARTGQAFGAQAQGLGAQAQGLGAELGASGAQTQAAGVLGGIAGKVGDQGIAREQLYTGAARDQQQLMLDAEKAQLESDQKAEAARNVTQASTKGGPLGMIKGFFGGLGG
jgi:hypothetical protein